MQGIEERWIQKRALISKLVDEGSLDLSHCSSVRWRATEVVKSRMIWRETCFVGGVVVDDSWRAFSSSNDLDGVRIRVQRKSS
jgi:hypothetical protein